MRLVWLTLGLFLAVPPSLCMALCATVTASVSEGASAPQQHEAPCHGAPSDAPSSDAEGCGHCESGSSFVPARADTEPLAIDLPTSFVAHVLFETHKASLACERSRPPPGLAWLAYHEMNPPLLI